MVKLPRLCGLLPESDLIQVQKTHIGAVAPSTPRQDVRVTFVDGGVYSGPVGTPLIEFMRAAYPADHSLQPILAAIVDNQLTELTSPIIRDVTVRPLSLNDSDGSRIYRRSLMLLLIVAVSELMPGVEIAVEHSIPTGGYYGEPVGRPNFSAEELDAIRKRMWEIVEADEPFVRRTLPLDDAEALFQATGDEEMVRLLVSREKDYVTVYSLRGRTDYLFGYMAPSTGSLRAFNLVSAGSGFILQFPQRETGLAITPYRREEKLEGVFDQAKAWKALMGLENFGGLNLAVKEGRLREEVLIAEALHSRYLGEIASAIAKRHTEGLRLVLIAGPSSSGKTTFSKRLAVQLMAYGIQPFTLQMDDFFVDRDKTPRDEIGDFDFESLETVDLARFNADLLQLMNLAETQLPRFDFKLGKRVDGELVRLSRDQIIIAEGIHGMNPRLVPDIPPERYFRIYVSALTTLNLDRHNRVPTTDVRLLRRLVRDADRRGYSAQETLDRWESVRRGEKKWIFPFQENADVMFNTGLAYELAVIRPFAEPLLRQVDPESPRYIEAKRLLALLSWVLPGDPSLVPDDSLLREFIGNSILETYSPGKRNGATYRLANGFPLA